MTDASKIFAEDRNGESLCVGDTVSRGRSRFRIEGVEWTVSGDGYYTETVYLTCKNLRSGDTRVFEDSEVLFLDRGMVS
jgi:hypothetical protein